MYISIRIMRINNEKNKNINDSRCIYTRTYIIYIYTRQCGACNETLFGELLISVLLFHKCDEVARVDCTHNVYITYEYNLDVYNGNNTNNSFMDTFYS